jgi:hypothetical protein
VMSSPALAELLVMELSNYQDAMTAITPCRNQHDVNGQSGCIRVIFDPLIDREAISPCWLKLIA